MKTKQLAIPLVVGLTVAVACAKPPQAEINAAQTALQSARAADAAEYAPEALTVAEDAAAALDAEIQAQQGKFALFRSYDEAKTKAAAAVQSAQTAAENASAAKEQARVDAANLIAQVTAQLSETSDMLAAAPTGKGTATDIAALKVDLQTAGTTLQEAEAAQTAGDYKEAQAKATAAMNSITSVRQAVEAARQLRTRRS